MGSLRSSYLESEVVGRDGELRFLERRVTEAAAGSGGTVLIAGEPGIGKSRLAAEIGRRAGGRGLRTIWGRCRETEGAPPLLPWAQVLRGLLDGAATDPPADVRPLLDLRPQARGADRFQLFDAATSFLVDHARREPLLLILDDLHRADHSSLLLLDFLVSALSGAPLLLVGTFRDTEVAPPHPILTTLGERAGSGGVELVALDGLTLEDTARLAAALAPAGTGLAPEELQRRCGGNPFFMTEVLRLGPGRGEWVPATVSAAISARVGRLPERTRRLLTPAAVLGREFRPQLVAALGGVPVDEVEGLFGPAVVAGLVRPAADDAGSYRFPHVLIREALYDAIPPSRRAALHDRLVRILEASNGNGATANDLASHAARAVRTTEERRRAVRLAVRAGGDARDRLAHEEAAVWFGRALALGADTAEERYALQMELGRCAGRASQVEQARTAYGQACALAVAEGWTGRMATIALGLGEVIDSAGTVDAGLVRMLEESLAQVAPADRSMRIALTARLAVEIYWGPRLPEARHLAADAVAAARRTGDGRALAVALAAQQFALRGPENLEERLRLGEELVVQSRVLRDEPLEVQARRLLLADRLQAEPALADADLQALDALAQQTRRPLARWYVMVNRCIRAGLADRPEQALALVESTEEFGRRIGARPAGMYGVAQRYFLRRECGRGAESEAELRAMILEYPRLATLRCALAVLLAEAGRRDEADALVSEPVADDCRAVPPDALWLSSLALLTIAASVLRRRADAATLHRLLHPHRGKIVLQGLVVWWGAVDHYLGLAATTLERWEPAAESFRSALALHERWAAAPFVRASLDGLAAVARGRGATPSAAPADGRAAMLTERESEVLRLLAAGAANKEIARRLYISVHTVERHVANVYGKIGVRNRSEATAFALRSGV
jgi:DNA-binding CsgD family transcriptional regulator